MRTCAEHWDFSDVVSRLEGAARARQFSSEGDLLTEASLAIKSLMASNKTLHRRAQAPEIKYDVTYESGLTLIKNPKAK